MGAVKSVGFAATKRPSPPPTPPLPPLMSARRLDAQLQEAALARHGASRQALEAQIQRTLQADRSVAEKTFHAVMKELDAILPLAAKPILEAAAVRKQCTPKQIQEMAKKVAAAPPIIADGAAADVRAFASEKRASVDVATRLWRETAETAARPLEESDAGVEAALRDVREAASRRRAEQGRLADAGAAVAERVRRDASRLEARARSVRREPAPLKRRDESALAGARRSLRADLESLRKATAASTTALDRDAKGAADASAAAAALADEAIRTEADSQARWAAEALQAVELLLQQLRAKADAAEEDRQAARLTLDAARAKTAAVGITGAAREKQQRDTAARAALKQRYAGRSELSALEAAIARLETAS